MSLLEWYAEFGILLACAIDVIAVEQQGESELFGALAAALTFFLWPMVALLLVVGKVADREDA